MINWPSPYLPPINLYNAPEQTMKQPTLNGLLQETVKMDRWQFANAIGLRTHTLDRYWYNNRLVLNLLIAGYQREVMCE